MKAKINKIQVSKIGLILATLAVISIIAYFAVVETRMVLTIAKWVALTPILVIVAILVVTGGLVALLMLWGTLMLIVRQIAYNIGAGYAQGVTDVAKKEAKKASDERLKSLFETIEKSQLFNIKHK